MGSNIIKEGNDKLNWLLYGAYLIQFSGIDSNIAVTCDIIG